MKKKLLFLLKTLVSLGLLSFLLSQIDLSALLHALGSASLPYLALVLVTYLLSQLVSCLRWLFLARPLGFKLSFKEFLSFYFIGMFFNLFAPSTVGGDIGRVFYLARGGMENKERGATAYALVSVVADRAIGLAVLIWIGAVALAIFPMYSLPPIIRVITYAIALGFLLCWVSVPLIKRFLRYVGHPLMENLRLGLEVYWSRQSVVQVVLSWALHIDLPWSYAFILYPLVGLFSSLPISLNGIGLREGGYLFLLRQIDVSSEKAIAFGLLWFLIVALDSLIGGLVFVLKKNPRSSSDRLGYRGQVK
jgi:uncharacterized membrane protein YbhN (UPF0104 family)